MCGQRAACSQVSAVLFYTRTAKFVQAQICVGDMRVSRLQVKGWQQHLSQNIGPATAGSARPVPPPCTNDKPCDGLRASLCYTQSLITTIRKEAITGRGTISALTNTWQSIGYSLNTAEIGVVK